MNTLPLDDQVWMQRALTLAKKGQGAVEPNPMVGAVVLSANGEWLAEGYHQKFGGPHAEVHALQAAGAAAEGGTLFVALEPCCHHGKTPPCTEAVIRAGIRRVVVGMLDPFPKVAGGGAKLLREAGCEVIVGVCENECRELNAPYLKLLHLNEPWVIGKWAMTLDGKIATTEGQSKWISNEASRARVHELRGRVDAVVVGRGTVWSDDPLLTARPAGARVPARVVVAASGDLPPDAQLLQTLDQGPVMVITTPAGEKRLQDWKRAGAEIVALPRDTEMIPVRVLLQHFGNLRWTNILVEGGAGLLGTFHDADALDETWVFVAPKVFGGAAAPSPVGGFGRTLTNLRLAQETTIQTLQDDVWIRTRYTSAEGLAKS
ncbi:MAG: bifunctional diaminohydroxyphosphoribosylaminopyrimidine deaminase/5-amino-6-(5-phosphoribosylamino)uracil reductase RibD [Fimbriiglobus sp.]